ncbi:MFS transporter [Micromonospora sp. DR5-3]|uniref:MFS transporter n=1 Tax=unclassified Micromonospora TaxID=2617518 RepID=UPI0011DB79C5|nr:MULTISPECIES: MFS transporter [unclassified Micromonospora]MCW3815083.1 MFS transporter [Micromonospora sp. DR5-3]TYC25394.1 MFS transporter [Micromonospora sp. MP36]
MSAVTAAPPGTVGTSRHFRTFWLAQAISQFGDRITELALPLIAVTMLAATPGQVGVLTALIWLPYLFGVFVGAWVDQRTHKRRLLVVADLIRAAVLVSLPVAYLLDVVSLAQLFVVAVLTGAGAVLFAMAYPSFFVTLVPSTAYIDANSKLSLSRAGSFVAGPALGGALVQLLTAPVALAADALSFLGSALLIGRIPTDGVPPAPTRSSARTRIRDGLALLLRHRVLRAALGATTTVNFFTFIATALLVLYASRDLGLSAGAIGLGMGAGALGGVAGAALAPRVARAIGVGRTAVIGTALFPAPLALLALGSGPTGAKIALLAGVEFVSSVGVMLMDINLNALIAKVTPDGARGRTAGAYSTVNYGIRPLGALIGGWLGTAIGLRPTLVLAGVAGASAALWLILSPVRRITTLDDEAAAAAAESPDGRTLPEAAPAG